MRQRTKKPLRRETRRHRPTSGCCIRTDRVCQKTMCERICGTASQQPTRWVTRRDSQQITNYDCTSYDSAQIAEANKLAREWKPKAP